MVIIELPQSFLTGHNQIDAEHRNLMGIINNADPAMKQHNWERFASLQDEFKDQCEAHFLSEEKILEQLGYPELDIHKIYHTKLINKGDELRQKYSGISSLDDCTACYRGMLSMVIDDVARGDTHFVSHLAQLRDYGRSEFDVDNK